MSHTNSTPNYNLPQFVTTDKPAWLTDINVAFSDIDTAIDAAKDAADNAQSDATQALSDASTAGTTASAADTKANGAISSLSDTFSNASTYTVGELVIYNSLLYKCIAAVTTPGAWTGVTNWSRVTVEELVGNLNNLTTIHKTSLTAAVNDAYDTAAVAYSEVDGKVNVATFNFNKTVAATTEASISVTRSELSLPANTQVVDGYLRLNDPTGVNAGFQYSFAANATSLNALVGKVYNSTNVSRSYNIMAVVFYKKI